MRILFISNNKLKEEFRRKQLSVIAEPSSITFLYSITEADNFLYNQVVKYQEPLDLIISDENVINYKMNKFFERIRFGIKETYSKGDFNLREVPSSIILKERKTPNNYYENCWVQNYYSQNPNEELPTEIYVTIIKNWRRQVLKELRDLGVKTSSGNLDYSYYLLSNIKKRSSTKILSSNYQLFPRKLSYDWLNANTDQISFLIDEFVRKLKRSEITKKSEEKLYHRFFNDNQSILRRDAYRKYFYEPRLYYNEKEFYEPDFVLQPEMTIETELSVLEVKLPNELIAKKKKFHPTLRSKFMDHLFQINDYKEYLENYDHRIQINKVFGSIPQKVAYNILIGRNDHKEENEYLIKKRMEEMNSKINIITYDDLLEYQVKYLERLQLLKIKH